MMSKYVIEGTDRPLRCRLLRCSSHHGRLRLHLSVLVDVNLQILVLKGISICCLTSSQFVDFLRSGRASSVSRRFVRVS